MKTKTGMILGLGLILSTIANAQEGKGMRPPHKLGQEVIAKFDLDGDGKLNEKEREAAKLAHQKMMEERKQAMLKRFDADGSGDLDESEKKVMKETIRKEMLARFDEDRDGKLSSTEKEKMRAETGEHLGRPRPPHGKGKKGSPDTEAPGERI